MCVPPIPMTWHYLLCPIHQDKIHKRWRNYTHTNEFGIAQNTSANWGDAWDYFSITGETNNNVKLICDVIWHVGVNWNSYPYCQNAEAIVVSYTDTHYLIIDLTFRRIYSSKGSYMWKWLKDVYRDAWNWSFVIGLPSASSSTFALTETDTPS